MLAAHPARALVLEAMQAESQSFAKDIREGTLPPFLREPVTEEIVSWLALLSEAK